MTRERHCRVHSFARFEPDELIAMWTSFTRPPIDKYRGLQDHPHLYMPDAWYSTLCAARKAYR